MPTLTKFYSFSQEIGKGSHDLSAGSFKLMLTNAAPSLSNTVKSDITEISAGNGYAAGGAAVSITSFNQASGIAKWIIADIVFTASGGSIGTFRYAVIYNTANNKLVGFIDHGSSVTKATGETHTWDFDATNGALQVS